MMIGNHLKTVNVGNLSEQGVWLFTRIPRSQDRFIGFSRGHQVHRLHDDDDEDVEDDKEMEDNNKDSNHDKVISPLELDRDLGFS